MFRLFCLVLLGWLGTAAAVAQDEAYRSFYSADTLRRHELAVAQRSALRAEIPVPKTGSSEYRALTAAWWRKPQPTRTTPFATPPCSTPW